MQSIGGGGDQLSASTGHCAVREAHSPAAIEEEPRAGRGMDRYILQGQILVITHDHGRTWAHVVANQQNHANREDRKIRRGVKAVALISGRAISTAGIKELRLRLPSP